MNNRLIKEAVIFGGLACLPILAIHWVAASF